MENVEERRQGSMHSSPQHEIKATLRLHDPAALTPNMKAQYPLNWKLGWSQNRSDGLEKRESCLCWETSHKYSSHPIYHLARCTIPAPLTAVFRKIYRPKKNLCKE
jgi:hypothetical protein